MNVQLVALVGVPEIKHVLVLSDSPAGTLPENDVGLLIALIC